MFINNVPFLLSVSKPLNLLQVADAATSRNSSTIRVGMENHIRTLESHGYKVMCIHSDGERAISAVADIMASRGVSFNPAGPGQRVQIVERKIRQVKERCRCIMNTLRYTLPIKWIFWLLAFVVFTINRTPVAGGNSFVSAQECLVGRKLDYRKDLRMEFEQYIQAWTPNNVKNSMKPRTEGCIALTPVGNIQGSIWCYTLRTGKVVRRDQWIPLPMPTEVIEAVNALSNSEDDVPRALTFHNGDHNIADDPESHGGDDQGTDTIVARTSEEAAVPVSPSGDVASIASGDDSTVS